MTQISHCNRKITCQLETLFFLSAVTPGLDDFERIKLPEHTWGTLHLFASLRWEWNLL
jgi:hypothetical protein